ncbi:hypothetical protein BD413DRAFT_31187 [Trametes elegans]|nr:hypothetical protein BD413DRAFT_31187 [Trametes elegans]
MPGTTGHCDDCDGAELSRIHGYRSRPAQPGRKSQCSFVERNPTSHLRISKPPYLLASGRRYPSNSKSPALLTECIRRRERLLPEGGGRRWRTRRLRSAPRGARFPTQTNGRPLASAPVPPLPRPLRLILRLPASRAHRTSARGRRTRDFRRE